MIQLLCFSNYSPQKFNQIPCFDRQVPIMGGLDLPGVLRKIGQVFIKYEAQKEFGLSIIHRHFHLNSNEILVDVGKADGTVSIAAPWHFTRDGKKLNCGFYANVEYVCQHEHFGYYPNFIIRTCFNHFKFNKFQVKK